MVIAVLAALVVVINPVWGIFAALAATAFVLRNLLLRRGRLGWIIVALALSGLALVASLAYVVSSVSISEESSVVSTGR
ncbi:hypothetical protein [Puerhibacterium puerhi]|uniref:hypothetical protein n=1 Tax=Puerhibacterium puerhi TaxID=2692623 RepID=UPI00135B332C|nr:hypothetical protein [Puerhibacterium puerhi]